MAEANVQINICLSHQILQGTRPHHPWHYARRHAWVSVTTTATAAAADVSSGDV